MSKFAWLRSGLTLEKILPLRKRATEAAGLSKTFLKTYYSVSSGAPEETSMPHRLLAETAASISELKANPMKVVASGKGMPVVVLNRNEPAFYCVPAGAYEAMMELIEDHELLEVVRQREHEESVRVSVDDL
jgi:antitoxin StbD